MKKLLIILILFLCSLRLIAPEFHSIIIFPGQTFYRWGLDYLSWAIAKVESNHNPLAINPVSGAIGLMQIMQPTIDEANRLAKIYKLKKHYTLNDAWSPKKSIEIWKLMNKHHNPEYELDKACRLWFGSGKEIGTGRTWEDYKKLIQKYLKP
jgi:hypothetical protein